MDQARASTPSRAPSDGADLDGGGAGPARHYPAAAREVPAARKAIWRVYRDPDNYLASSSGCSAFWSAFATFNLAVMGSSVLPMPYAISRTGLLVGMLLMLLVALCNDYTTCLMISAAYATGLDSFESLAQWAGGPRWKVFTQWVLITLLWAPNSGGLSLMGDLAQVMVDQVHIIRGGNAAAAAAGAAAAAAAALPTAAAAGGGGRGWALAGREWLMGCLGDGQSWMVVLTLLAVLPLSCQKHMRNLETAAAAGLVVVLGLLVVLAYGAISNGLPAVTSGQLQVWSLKLNDQLPEAFSLLGYAFYLQPLIMPMIREMPEGRTGRTALTAAVHSALLGSSLFLYAGVGFFGAAWFGPDTASNIMLNQLTTSPWASLAINACMLFYLAAGAAACQYPLRTSIDALLVGEHVPMTLPRAVLINAVTLGVSLAVALVTPGGAEKVYAIVGASGVCIMCYVMPVAIHLKVLHVRRLQAKLHCAAKERRLQVSCDGGWSSPRQQQDDAAIDCLTIPLLAPSSPHSSVSSLTDLSGLPVAPHSMVAGGAVLPVRLAPCLLKPLVADPRRPAWLDALLRLVLPLLVMLLGIGFSVSALTVAIRDLWGA